MRIKYAPGQGVSVAKEGTNRGNGLTRDRQGRLVICEADARRVTRIESDGSTTVIANGYQGKQFGRPNDVVVKSNGDIFFTDPQGGASGEPWAVTVPGVYRVSADLGTMVLLINSVLAPNGLAFSPDEKACSALQLPAPEHSRGRCRTERQFALSAPTACLSI